MKYFKIVILLNVFLLVGCRGFNFNMTFPEMSKQFFEDGISRGVFDTNIDYGSPLLNQRIIIINSKISNHTATRVVSELFYLNSKNKTEAINIYLNTVGGDAHAGFTIV